ncbi:hypothetical protein NIES2100_45970 [Calothrix sp. NIES-2100]|nr:hypothetical protein NIES2100_45970 [Calothrix sp. NIES-2100]
MVNGQWSMVNGQWSFVPLVPRRLSEVEACPLCSPAPLRLSYDFI